MHDHKIRSMLQEMTVTQFWKLENEKKMSGNPVSTCENVRPLSGSEKDGKGTDLHYRTHCN